MGRALMSKTYDKCVKILDEIATNNYNYLKDRLILKRPSNMTYIE